MSKNQDFYDTQSDENILEDLLGNFAQYKEDFEQQPILSTPIIEYAKNSERGSALLAAELFKILYIYNFTANVYMRNVKGVWKADLKGKAKVEIISKIRELYLEESKKYDDQIPPLIKQGKTDDATQAATLRDLLRKEATALNKRSHIDNVLNLLSNFVAAIADDFDKNPGLLNLANGTYDFENGFKSHNPADLLSKQVAIYYDSKASCEKWLIFLNMIFKDNQELIIFIQKLIGYSLTGYTDIQALFFCHGGGANGKSTFFGVIKMLLGDYFCPIPIDTILIKQHDSTVEYQLAKMKGTRFVLASEVPKGRYLNESQVKDLTGGEMINARNPHEKPFSFVPTHKLWLFGNHKPVIKGTDHGI